MKQLDKQEKKFIKVVLDTNVLISALLFQKQLGIVFDLIQNNIITPYFIQSTFLEFQQVINYKKFESAIDRIKTTPQGIVDALSEQSVILNDPKEIPIILNDTPDNFILACALSAQADFIISGDKHLLALKQFANIPILTPRQFLKQFKKV